TPNRSKRTHYSLLECVPTDPKPSRRVRHRPRLRVARLVEATSILAIFDGPGLSPSTPLVGSHERVVSHDQAEVLGFHIVRVERPVLDLSKWSILLPQSDERRVT